MDTDVRQLHVYLHTTMLTNTRTYIRGRRAGSALVSRYMWLLSISSRKSKACTRQEPPILQLSKIKAPQLGHGPHTLFHTPEKKKKNQGYWRTKQPVKKRTPLPAVQDNCQYQVFHMSPLAVPNSRVREWRSIPVLCQIVLLVTSTEGVDHRVIAHDSTHGEQVMPCRYGGAYMDITCCGVIHTFHSTEARSGGSDTNYIFAPYVVYYQSEIHFTYYTVKLIEYTYPHTYPLPLDKQSPNQTHQQHKKREWLKHPAPRSSSQPSSRPQPSSSPSATATATSAGYIAHQRPSTSSPTSSTHSPRSSPFSGTMPRVLH